MILNLFTICCVSSLPFLYTLKGDFVFDDSEAIVKNKDVTTHSPIEAFYNDFWGNSIKSNFSHKSYRPLTILSFRLNYVYNRNQLNPHYYKITNLMCHTICCVMLWFSYQVIGRRVHYTKAQTSNISYYATLLFAVHPVHVEAISGIVGRADLLCAISFFSSFLLYQKATRTSNAISYVYFTAAVIFAACSMLFKENGITVLGFCIVFEIITKGNASRNKSKTRKKDCKKDQTKQTSNFNWHSMIRIVLLSVCIILLLLGRWLVMGRSKPQFKHIDNPAAFSDDYFVKIATYNYIYFINLLLLVWPEWLCFDWSMGCVPLIQNIGDYRNIFTLLLYSYGILVLTLFLKRSNQRAFKKMICLAVSLSVISFLPASNIFFPVGFVIAERILYIPSAGYCLLVALGYDKIVSIVKGSNFKVMKSLYLFLLVIYGLRSHKRSEEWQNEYELFLSGLSVCPLNAKVHYNVAKVADSYNQTGIALASYREAIRLYPEYYQAMNNLANVLKNHKEYTSSEYYLRAAISHKNDFPAAWMNLGIVLAHQKRYEESETAYKTALIYRHNYPDCYYNLGNLFLELNKTTEAVVSWQQAIKLSPKHTLAWSNLLSLLDNTGQVNKSLQIIPKALRELPDSPSINFAVANIYGKMERYEDAEKCFKKAIHLFGRHVQAIHYANLGVLYHRWKKYQWAEEMYEAALNIDPAFDSAQLNLKLLRKKLKVL